MEGFVSAVTLSARQKCRAHGPLQELPEIDEDDTTASAYTSGRAKRKFDIYTDRFFLLNAGDGVITVIWKDQNDAIMEKKFTVKKE